MKYILNFITDSQYYDEKTTKFFQKIKSNKLEPKVRSKILSNDNEDNFEVLKFEKTIDHHVSFIKEMSNGFFITDGEEDTIYIYDTNFELKKKLKLYITKNSQQSLQTKVDNNQIKEKVHKRTINIIETNNSIRKIKENQIEIMECSKYGLLQYEIDLNDNNNIININDSNHLYISCSGYFEINDKHFKLYGEKGLFEYNQKPFNLNTYKDK